MMGYGNWEYDSMMGGVGTLGFFIWFVVLVDLMLAGIWLWQQISKK